MVIKLLLSISTRIACSEALEQYEVICSRIQHAEQRIIHDFRSREGKRRNRRTSAKLAG